MECKGCGARLAPGSRYCNECGETVAGATAGQGGARSTTSLGGPAAAFATKVAARGDAEAPEHAEHAVFVVRPSFLFVGARYAVAAVLWLCATAAVAAVAGSFNLDRMAAAAVVVAIGLVLFAPAAVAHVRRQRYLYTLTNYKLEIQTGLVATTTRNVRLSKIQDVTVTRSILKRLFGVGDVVVDTAADAGRLVLRNIPDPKRYADAILLELRRWN